MRLLLIENKELIANAEKLREALERDNLKKALDFKKRCRADLENALHEIDEENKQVQLRSQTKLADANTLVAGIGDKAREVEENMLQADAKLAEANKKSLELERKMKALESNESALQSERRSFIAGYIHNCLHQQFIIVFNNSCCSSNLIGKMWYSREIDSKVIITSHSLYFSRPEFALITGMRFGTISFCSYTSANLKFRNRVFPHKVGLIVTNLDVLGVIKDEVMFGNLCGKDSVRLCLILALEVIFMVRSTTPPPDYPFDKSIFAELDNSLWIIPRPLGGEPDPEEPNEVDAYDHLWK
nr:phospholipase-like protein [Tanacetum cinerariifolium]